MMGERYTSTKYDRLSDFDNRLADLPGTVYIFSDLESWENCLKNCNPKALTIREKLAVIIYERE